MIASIRGQVLSASLDRAVLEVGGLGLAFHTTPATAARLQVGGQAAVFTALVVREDSLTLFGFGSEAERDAFEIVQSVSGIGPRIALAMVSVLGPARLAQAVAQEDLATLTTVPGIGKKSAQRIALELAGKFDQLAIEPDVAPTASATDAEVVGALTGLGWQQKPAERAVEAVLVKQPDADTAEVLRLALRELAGSSRG